jgi:hypothetical protein
VLGAAAARACAGTRRVTRRRGGLCTLALQLAQLAGLEVVAAAAPGGGAAGGGVALEEFDCEQSVVDGYAIAGSADTSPLWLEVSEETMPLSGGPLTQEEKDAVAAWIDSGALCEGGADTGR